MQSDQRAGVSEARDKKDVCGRHDEKGKQENGAVSQTFCRIQRSCCPSDMPVDLPGGCSGALWAFLGFLYNSRIKKLNYDDNWEISAYLC